MTQTERRAHPRFPARSSWSARYRPHEAPELDWRDCRVLDISRGGVALEVAGHEVLDGTVAIELYTFGDVPRDIALTGQVRGTTALSSGAQRVGLEFVGASAVEEQLLELLLRLVDA
jgi:hypothetical protein